MRSDDDIQFSKVELPEEQAGESSSWLRDFLDWLGDLFSPAAETFAGNWNIIFWVLAIIAIALVLFVLYRVIDPAKFVGRKSTIGDADWTPDQDQALALLEEADRLAGEGRYDEATHLLLQRSVGQIAEIRPDLIDPSSTAREISALPALPDTARTAFATIAERVERSLFALTALSADDWHAAREAYSEFALGYRGVRT